MAVLIWLKKPYFYFFNYLNIRIYQGINNKINHINILFIITYRIFQQLEAPPKPTPLKRLAKSKMATSSFRYTEINLVAKVTSILIKSALPPHYDRPCGTIAPGIRRKITPALYTPHSDVSEARQYALHAGGLSLG